MLFTDHEITLARRMRDYGLPWEPAPGHYVLDETGIIEAPSPFQERIYFILDLKHFLRRSGTIDELGRRMTWLPQWHQARTLARRLGISDARIAHRLAADQAIETRSELATLYQLIIDALQADTGSTAPEPTPAE